MLIPLDGRGHPVEAGMFAKGQPHIIENLQALTITSVTRAQLGLPTDVLIDGTHTFWVISPYPMWIACASAQPADAAAMKAAGCGVPEGGAAFRPFRLDAGGTHLYLMFMPEFFPTGAESLRIGTLR